MSKTGRSVDILGTIVFLLALLSLLLGSISLGTLMSAEGWSHHFFDIIPTDLLTLISFWSSFTTLPSTLDRFLAFFNYRPKFSSSSTVSSSTTTTTTKDVQSPSDEKDQPKETSIQRKSTKARSRKSQILFAIHVFFAIAAVASGMVWPFVSAYILAQLHKASPAQIPSYILENNDQGNIFYCIAGPKMTQMQARVSCGADRARDGIVIVYCTLILAEIFMACRLRWREKKQSVQGEEEEEVEREKGDVEEGRVGGTERRMDDKTDEKDPSRFKKERPSSWQSDRDVKQKVDHDHDHGLDQALRLDRLEPATDK